GREIRIDPSTGHPVAAEVLDAADSDHYQPGCRAFDRQFRIANARREDRPDDRRKDAGNRRIAT
ncbi:MAG: hypothetical protein IIC09_00915, partial [Proteobacteria bacterium]|nr:hypothetical protein [Pseudomonadota bacterium]